MPHHQEVDADLPSRFNEVEDLTTRKTEEGRDTARLQCLGKHLSTSQHDVSKGALEHPRNTDLTSGCTSQHAIAAQACWKSRLRRAVEYVTGFSDPAVYPQRPGRGNVRPLATIPLCYGLPPTTTFAAWADLP